MRLIDKDLLLERLKERKRPNPHGKDNRYYYWLELYNYVYDAPTVDAVPVIRCKDCKYFEYDHFDAVYFPTETGEAERVPLITAHEICTRWGDGCKTSEDGYCFMAERKEHETD